MNHLATSPERLQSQLGRAIAIVDMPLELLNRRPGLAIGLSAFAAAILLGAFAFHLAVLPDLPARLGIDLRQYADAADRWLDGGSFYQPWQLTATYTLPRDEFDVSRLPVLYPPYALVLLVPFTVGPAIAPLWWLIPLGVTAAIVRRWRPLPWTWPLLTLCALSGDTIWLTISGNPVMWVIMFVALGTVYRWPSVGVLLKPTLAPFALVRAGSRSWWVALAAFGIVALPFGHLWIDYFSALRNLDGSGPLYSIGNVPMVLIPAIAWLGRSTREYHGGPWAPHPGIDDRAV